jgi:hypothetical protein
MKNRRLKSFENYEIVQRFDGFSCWRKTYENGKTDTVLVCNDYCTRTLIKSAFIAFERGEIDGNSVFTRKDAIEMNYAH